MENALAFRFPTLILLVVFSLLATLGLCRLLGEHPEELATDARLAARYRVRQWAAHLHPTPGRIPAVSDGVCLVGIDDQTLLHFGKFGSGSWAVREPFCQLLPVLGFYQPSAVGFDILFRPAGELDERGVPRQPPSPESVRKAAGHLLDPESTPTARDLLELTRFASHQAESFFAAQLLFLSQPPPGQKTPGVPVVCAFDFQGGGLSGDGRSFSRADILGSDPDSRDERAGETVPCLLDTAIPGRNLHGVPADYVYATGATLPSSAIRDAVRHGFINVPRDGDGIIRRIPLVMGFSWTNPATGRVRREFVPSLPLLCVLDHWGLKPADIEVTFGDAVVLKRPPPHRELRIPIDGQGRMYLNYAGRLGDFPNVSMLHLLPAGRRDAMRGAEAKGGDFFGMLRNRICLVGLTATGSTDIGPCPIDSNTPYVHIHMTAIGNILAGRFLSPPGEWLSLAVLASLALPALLILRRGGMRRLILGMAGLLAAYHALAFLLLFRDAALLPAVAPTAFVALTALGVFASRHRAEILDRRRVRAMFSTMVSPEVLRFMEEHPESFSVAGRRAEATILFSDIAGFTSFSEQHTPERVTAMLNDYFDTMAGIIMSQGGYVDKFEGDAIMAVWGAPYAMEDHAAAACRAALDQRDAVLRLRPSFREKYGVELSVRFGVNSGIVLAGNMGSRHRFQYTVMGDVVNQAARLEPANKDYGTSILIGEAAHERVQDAFITRLLDKVILAGKSAPACIYELVAAADAGLPAGRKAAIDLYEKALRLHWERDWDAAEQRLRQALELLPGEPAALMLMKRIAALRQTPPTAGWHGEHVRSSKD